MNRQVDATWRTARQPICPPRTRVGILMLAVPVEKIVLVVVSDPPAREKIHRAVSIALVMDETIVPLVSWECSVLSPTLVLRCVELGFNAYLISYFLKNYV